MLNAKPQYLIFVHWVGDKAWFTPINEMTVPEAKKHYDYYKLVPGKAATVHCFFSDYDLRDEDIIHAATIYMKGEYMSVEVNLRTFERKVFKGVDKTHPRQ